MWTILKYTLIDRFIESGIDLAATGLGKLWQATPDWVKDKMGYDTSSEDLAEQEILVKMSVSQLVASIILARYKGWELIVSLRRAGLLDDDVMAYAALQQALERGDHHPSTTSADRDAMFAAVFDDVGVYPTSTMKVKIRNIVAAEMQRRNLVSF